MSLPQASASRRCRFKIASIQPINRKRPDAASPKAGLTPPFGPNPVNSKKGPGGPGLSFETWKSSTLPGAPMPGSQSTASAHLRDSSPRSGFAIHAHLHCKQNRNKGFIINKLSHKHLHNKGILQQSSQFYADFLPETSSSGQTKPLRPHRLRFVFVRNLTL